VRGRWLVWWMAWAFVRGAGLCCWRQLLRWLPIVPPGLAGFQCSCCRVKRENLKTRSHRCSPQVEFVGSDSTASRLGWLTAGLPRKLSSLRADVLFSFANVGVAFCPIPKVVYCQQSLAIYSGTQQYLGKWMRLEDGAPSQADPAGPAIAVSAFIVQTGVDAASNRVTHPGCNTRRAFGLRSAYTFSLYLPSG